MVAEEGPMQVSPVAAEVCKVVGGKLMPLGRSRGGEAGRAAASLPSLDPRYVPLALGGPRATLPTETTSPRLPGTLPRCRLPRGLLGGYGGVRQGEATASSASATHSILPLPTVKHCSGGETLVNCPVRCGAGGAAAIVQVASGKLRWERGVLGRGVLGEVPVGKW